jgi:hypothetical protein
VDGVVDANPWRPESAGVVGVGVLDILGLADEPLVAGETKNVEVLHGDGLPYFPVRRNPFSTDTTMQWYQIYFFFLKIVVFAQIVLTALGFEVAKSPVFAVVDTLFKTSLGLFLGIYFWLFRPKGLNWEDGIIVSIGGFLILTEIRFEPLLEIYDARDKILNTAVGHKASE